MAIAKKDATKIHLNAAEVAEVALIERGLDASIQSQASPIRFTKQNFAPSEKVIAALRGIYEAEEMGWTLRIERERDGVIIFLD